MKLWKCRQGCLAAAPAHKCPFSEEPRAPEAGEPGGGQAWFETGRWCGGLPEGAVWFRALPEGDGVGPDVEDGVSSLPGLIIQLGKTHEVFRSDGSNLIRIPVVLEGQWMGSDLCRLPFLSLAYMKTGGLRVSRL